MKVRIFPENNYKGIYNNGKTIRIALDPSKPITELDYPEFYDVKITDFCEGRCPYCYMDSKPEDQHAENIIEKVMDFFALMDMNERPFQVAIGGGEPTSHPHFIECLRTFHGLHITPNYTTNGMFVIEKYTNDIINATKKYCGGVAVSCHPHLDVYWTAAAGMFSEAGIKLNFHIIISDRDSIDRCKWIYDHWKDVVEYFVLLPHGAQGRATKKDIDWDYLKEVLPDDSDQFAFGANFHPYLTKDPGQFKVSLYEPESMSKFLDLKDMKLYPSSFMLDKEIPLIV